MNEGDWIKLHRSLLDSEVFADADLLKVWVWVLLRAAYCPRLVTVRTGRGVKSVRLDVGQFIFGAHSAAEELIMPKSTVQDRMKRLETMRNIRVQPGTHCSIVTVCHWSTYQAGEREARQPNTAESGTQPAAQTKRKRREKSPKTSETRDPPGTHPASNRHPSGTNKKGKKVRSNTPNGVLRTTELVVAIPKQLDRPEFHQAWASWQKHRRELKLPLTPATAAEQLEQLAAWGVDRAVSAIKHSIRRAWKNIFEETQTHDARTTNHRPQSPAVVRRESFDGLPQLTSSGLGADS